ncbi:uncharacterized protein LOC134238082 [Saccostrea cucullata]|uniref:uncharacterized protein LOC134238082 n=1 Tax=Saccostrea cuccullata TaxID=36930 RepID=UPI002ED46A5F
MKARLVHFQPKYMAYEIEEIDTNEEEKFDLQQMELRHLLVLFALLLTNKNQFCLENDEWVEQLKRVNKDFKLPAKTEYILGQRLLSKKLNKYIVQKDKNIVFKSTHILGIIMQYFSEKENYVEYFVQNATYEGLRHCCMTSSHSVIRPAIILNEHHLVILIKRLKYRILFHPVMKDNSIHKIVSKSLKIPKVILSWDEKGRKAFVKSLQEDKEDIFHARWMILGCAGVGKTTLVKKIRDLSMEEILNTLPTEGVEMHNRIFEVTGNSLQDVTNKNISPFGITLKKSFGKPIKVPQDVPQNTQYTISKLTPKVNTTMLYTRDAQQIPKTMSSGKDNAKLKDYLPNSEEATESHSSSQEKKYISSSNPSDVYGDAFIKLIPFLWNKVKSAKCTIDIVDFAGQSDYYASHQVFLRQDAGYILVLNMAEKLDDIPSTTISHNMIYENWTNRDFVQNWLRSIHTFAPLAPVILVATHAEGKSSREIQQFFVDVWNVPNVEKLKIHLDEDRKFWVTLREDDNITELKDCIANQSKTLATWGKEIPRKWVLCENFLKETKKTRKIITLHCLLGLIKRKQGYLKMSKNELTWMLKFFHDIGEIIYFDEKDLEKIVILDVDFLLDIFKCIIRTDLNVRGKIARQFGNRWTAYEQRGLLGEKMCMEMLKELLDLRAKDQIAFFQYLTHIGIMIDITEPNVREKLWYIPSMNKSLFPFDAYESYMRTPVHCFVADFLPDIIYHRLISKAITSHSIGEVLLDGNEKCMYQSVCAFLHDETYIVLIGRCETSLQVQILATVELDKSVCSALLGKVSNIINDVASTFHLNIEFSEGLLCDQSQITDQFRTSGMLMCDIQQACERKSTFLCKTCPISRRHLINSKEWLSFTMDTDEPEEEDEEKEDLVEEKRDMYLLFDFVATKIGSIFEARSLCFELLGDEFVLENDKKHNPRRVLFDALVTWIERNPTSEHLEILTRALQKISRCDIVQNIHCIEHRDYTEHYVPHPDLDIKQSDIKAVVKDAAVNYLEIGLFLGLSPQKLKQIELDYPSDVRGKMHQVLSQLPVSRQMIINSLKYVERIDLIAKLTARWN